MNKSLIAERFSKAITTYSEEANVQRQIAGKMIRLLQEHLSGPCPSHRIRLWNRNLFPYVAPKSSPKISVVE